MFRSQVKIFIPGKTRITYGAAIFGKSERRAVEAVLDRNWWLLNGEGEMFEKELSNFVGTKYSILTNSGSSALLLALTALNLPPRTGVAVPATCFPTAFNAIIRNSLIPFVIDSDIKNFNLSLEDAERAFKQGAQAIIAVHVAGNPVEMPELIKLAKKYKAYVIEDNCDGLGGSIKDKLLGSFGDIGCTSMFAGHIINMGEGGAVFCNNENIAKRVRSLRDWGRADESDLRHVDRGLPKDYPARYVYTEIGYNLKPLELQAAMGRVQLKKIGFIKKKRQENFNKLKKIFSKRYGISVVERIKNSRPSWFAFPILTEKRPFLIKTLEDNKIETRPIFAGNILKHPAYRNIKVKRISDLKGADEIMNKGLFLGVHPLIPPKAFDYIQKVADNFYKSK